MESSNCPVCGRKNAAVADDTTADAVNVDCKLCGKYQLSGTLAALDIPGKYGQPSWVLSGAIRNRFEDNRKTRLSTDSVELLLESARPPTDPFESINLLIRHFHRVSQTPGSVIEFNTSSDFPVLYARDLTECSYYLKKATELGLVENGGAKGEYQLGLEGWRQLLDYERRKLQARQAFVAMWFHPTLDRAWHNGFRPGLEEAGYFPFRIDQKEHNDKIDDQIVAEIRRSGLVVADFTGHRGGVYFEAGLAMGLGIPVVWTCRSDMIDHTHFDTRQYSHVVWKDETDLKEKLNNRVRATHPITSFPAP